MTTKECASCSNTFLGGINHCVSCQQHDEDDVLCMECEEGWWPNYEQDACVMCRSDEVEVDGECHKCSDFEDWCGACQFNDEEEFECKACLPGIPWIEEDGEYVGCGCSFVEYVHILDPYERTEAECRPCLTYEGQEACDGCAQETTFIEETQMWHTELYCVECQIPYFLNEEGYCSMEACATWNELGECKECNSKSDFVYIP